MLTDVMSYLKLAVVIAATVAFLKRSQSTGDRGYTAVVGVVVGVALVTTFAKVWTWLWFARYYRPLRSFDGVAHGFDEARLLLMGLGLVIALYVVDRRPGSGNLWRWLWSERKPALSQEEPAR